jgi:hypothetical protein
MQAVEGGTRQNEINQAEQGGTRHTKMEPGGSGKNQADKR